jgi:hypothetical protein
MKILFTTALIPQFYENRKQEYIDSFSVSKDLVGLENIFVIECFSNPVDNFLHDLTDNVYYSNTNDSSINKGVKEGRALKKFFEENEFYCEEFLIKQTGRYRFISDLFFTNFNQEVDVNVLYGENNNCFFGMFAMKSKHFKNFINSLDFDFMERNMISIETSLSQYIQQKNLSVQKHDKLDVYSNINNSHVVIW